MALDWHAYFRFRTIVPATILGAAAFSICVQPAGAFFPPVDNGGKNGPTETPNPPPKKDDRPVPPLPCPFCPPPRPPQPPPPPPPPRPNNPVETPEPATLVMAGIGLAVAAAARRKKGGAKE